ncbi:hypothetical protein [Lacinutrix chionoecetis]
MKHLKNFRLIFGFIMVLIFFNCKETSESATEANTSEKMEAVSGSEAVDATGKVSDNEKLNSSGSNQTSVAILDPNATVKYKFTHDDALDVEHIKVTIGGKVSDPDENKIKGVEINSSGDIFVEVIASKGSGSWKLEITDVIMSNGSSKKVEPKASEDIHVTNGTNRLKFLVFRLK